MKEKIKDIIRLLASIRKGGGRNRQVLPIKNQVFEKMFVDENVGFVPAHM